MSGLKAFYGDYEHAAGEAYPRLIEVTPVYSDRGIRWALDYRITMEGQFCADPATPLTAGTVNSRIATLNEAYAEDYKDFGFLYQTSGGGWSATEHYMKSNSATNLTGNRVLKRSWVHRTPTELANTRSYSVTMGARYRDSSTTLVYSRETVDFIGTGGPDWVYRETFRGLPVRDDLNEKTVVHVIQSGTRITLDPYPIAGIPLFPEQERGKMRRIRRTSPTSHGNPSGNFTHYRVDYTYHMFLPFVPGSYPGTGYV